MKRSLIVLVLCFVITHFSSAQYEAKNQILDDFIQKGIADWQIPGMVTVVVKNSHVVFQKAYGVKDINIEAAVDEQTKIFCFA
jgi:CubicO group peptidase (beta-lactamase class C family)